MNLRQKINEFFDDHYVIVGFIGISALVIICSAIAFIVGLALGVRA